MKLKKGDKVLVISGKYKGEVGKVIKIIKDRAIVQGINRVKKHVKSLNPEQKKPTIVQVERPIHVSNLMIIDSTDNKPTRVGYKFIEKDGKKVKIRVSKRTGQEIKVDRK
ncbi:MAG: 50S ribosomal protein L24 [Candidatus Calescibacterium sp.]|nr:50S ribosomal protein L24 [Candidatus Calescibacterium sp.]MCX7972711.1 50S ribosomal protein L24 [bacterium]MDW8195515.1 50S ribosomal protein L24 [Candidatus Calescibacterium sp.]